MRNKICFLSGNMLKVLAAIFMTIDHIGVLLLPNIAILRYIGRLAYPIFAFMIAEGARYTKNKVRYLGLIAGLAFICQLVYYFFDNGSLYMCILVTFSLSIILIYSLQFMKKCLFEAGANSLKKIIGILVFLSALTLVYLLNEWFTIDYGFLGCVAPVFASLLDFRGIEVSDVLVRLDNLYLRIGVFGIGILMLAIRSGGMQYFSLLALALLFLYSGTRGRLKMKYFFYLFYPLHLVALEGIYILIHLLK